MKSIVILVKGSDCREMVRSAINLVSDEFEQKVKASKQLFLHPNLVNGKNPAACTNIETLRGVLDHLSLITDKKVLVGDAGYHDTKMAFENLDFESLKRSGKIKILDLNDDETVKTFAYSSEKIKVPSGVSGSYDEKFNKKPIGFSQTVAGSDFNIVVVPAKMHSYYTVSLSLKTHVVGSMIVKRSPFGIHARWPWLHTGYKQAHQTLAESYLEHLAQLAIIDGVHGMEGNGPASGEVINANWLVLSFDPIAADFLACYLMGFDPYKEVGYLHLLADMDKGPKSLDDLEIMGEDPKSLRKEWQKPSSWPEILDWR